MTQLLTRRWLRVWLVVLLQLAATSLIWLVWHLPNPQRLITSGWFDPNSQYAQSMLAWSPVAWWQTRALQWRWPLLISLVGGCYGLGLLVLRQRASELRLITVLLATTLIALPLVFAPQMLSADVYGYALQGRITLLYRANPFLALPAEFGSDPLLPFVAWKTTASVYGPAWVVVTLPLTALAELIGGQVWAYVLVYKAAALACHLATAAVIARILQRTRPELAAWGALVYAWHPLALIEFAGSAHNDSLLLLLIMLALLCAMERRSHWTVVLLAVAGMVKITALFLIPIYVLFWLRQQPVRRLVLLVQHGLLSLLVIAALYAPFWAGPRTLEVMLTAPQLTRLVNGPAAWAVEQIENRTCRRLALERESEGVGRAPTACAVRLRLRERLTAQARSLALAIFSVTYVLLLGWPLRSLGAMIARWHWVLLATLLLVAGLHFEPWYGTWLLVCAPLLSRLRPFILLASGGLLLVYSNLPLATTMPLAFAPILLLIIVGVGTGLNRKDAKDAKSLRTQDQ